MLSVLFFMASLLLVAFVLIKGRGFRAIRYFTIVSVLFVNLGFLLNHLATGMSDASPSAIGLLVTTLGLLSVVIGGLIGYQIFGRLEGEQLGSLAAEMMPRVEKVNSAGSLVVLAVVILVPTWLYFVLLGDVPLFDGIKAVFTSGLGGLGELNRSRLSQDVYVTGAGTHIPLQGLLAIYRNIGAPILFAYALIQLRRGAHAMPRYVVMAVCVVSVMAAGQRWPLMYLITAAIFVFSADLGKLSPKVFRRLAVVTVVMGILLSALQARTVTTLNTLGAAISFGASNLFTRILTDQVAVPIASYYSDSPALTWNLGRTYLESLASYLPGPGVSYPVEFYRVVTGDPLGFTAPPDFYTEAYINFSWYGVVGICLIWGILLAFFDVRIYASSSSWDIAMKAGLLTVLVFSVISGLVFTVSFVFVAVGCGVARFVGGPYRKPPGMRSLLRISSEKTRIRQHA